LVSVLIVTSCATKNNNIQHNGNMLIVENGIEIEKAKIMVSEFLNQERTNNIHGKISVNVFEEKYRKECLEFPMAKEHFKEFCNAQYVIAYSADTKCIGGSRVIENCESGACNYRISEYSEVCE
jgi:hypothetical protein